MTAVARREAVLQQHCRANQNVAKRMLLERGQSSADRAHDLLDTLHLRRMAGPCVLVVVGVVPDALLAAERLSLEHKLIGSEPEPAFGPVATAPMRVTSPGLVEICKSKNQLQTIHHTIHCAILVAVVACQDDMTIAMWLPREDAPHTAQEILVERQPSWQLSGSPDANAPPRQPQARGMIHALCTELRPHGEARRRYCQRRMMQRCRNRQDRVARQWPRVSALAQRPSEQTYCFRTADRGCDHESVGQNFVEFLDIQALITQPAGRQFGPVLKCLQQASKQLVRNQSCVAADLHRLAFPINVPCRAAAADRGGRSCPCCGSCRRVP